jgi:hypothetical protein
MMRCMTSSAFAAGLGMLLGAVGWGLIDPLPPG